MACLDKTVMNNIMGLIESMILNKITVWDKNYDFEQNYNCI